MPLLTKFLVGSRMKKIEPYISGDVLDLGCNNAAVYQQHSAKIERYAGVDISQDNVSLLGASFPNASFYSRDLDEDRLDFGDSFDVVLMVALIERLFNQKHIMKQVFSTLKPGGRVVITTPTPFDNDVVHKIGASLGLFSRVAAADHIVVFNKKRLGLLAQETGFLVDEYRTFQFGCNQLCILKKVAINS